jgi:hypothetical protein
MSIEGNFERSRIQDPEKAHEEANMLKAQAEKDWARFRHGKENLTADDYDDALVALEKLQGEVLSPTAEKAMKPVREIMASVGSLSINAQDLVGWSLLSVVPASLWEKIGIEEDDLPQERLIKFVKALSEGKLGKDYRRNRTELSSAREILERRRIEAEEIAKR